MIRASAWVTIKFPSFERSRLSTQVSKTVIAEAALLSRGSIRATPWPAVFACPHLNGEGKGTRDTAQQRLGDGSQSTTGGIGKLRSHARSEAIFSWAARYFAPDSFANPSKAPEHTRKPRASPPCCPACPTCFQSSFATTFDRQPGAAASVSEENHRTARIQSTLPHRGYRGQMTASPREHPRASGPVRPVRSSRSAISATAGIGLSPSAAFADADDRSIE